MNDYKVELLGEIDDLRTDNEQLQDRIDVLDRELHRWEIQAMGFAERNERLEVKLVDRTKARDLYFQETKKLKAELDKHKPKSLLFGGLGKLGFDVIINNEVPENEIWFATNEQFATALEYSEQQIKKALEVKP